MAWLKALHVISIVCWFAGLFYLPRLYVYHAETRDELGHMRFKMMEHRLYWYIMTPAALATVLFGLCLWLPHYDAYRHALWLHVKLPLVLILLIYHGACGHFLRQFASGRNRRSERFYRLFNEVPTVLLIAIVLLSYVKP